MALFPTKTKTQEVTYIDKMVIVIGGNKYHRHDHELQEIKDTLKLLLKNQKIIMATQKEDAQVLRDLKTQLSKANDEIQAKIQALVDAAANSDTVSDELQTAIDELKPAAQALDDIVPDAPTV